MRGGQALALGNLKPGVVVSNNVFTQSIPNAQPAISLDFGTGVSNFSQAVGITNLTLSNNVIYDWTAGIDIGAGQTPGVAGPTALTNITFNSNQFENLSNTPLYNHAASYTSQEHFSGNTYYNTPQSSNAGKSTPPVGQVLTKPIAFANPSVSIASYDATIGGNGTQAAFLAAAAQQNETAWKSIYDASAHRDLLRQGFSRCLRRSRPR